MICDTATGWRAKCDYCGRFYRHGEPGSSSMFVPDSYVSYEETGERCRACTAAHGPPIPSQSVRREACVGIVGPYPEEES